MARANSMTRARRMIRNNPFSNILKFYSQIREHLGGLPFLLPEQAQEQVFSTYMVMPQVLGLFHSVLKYLLHLGREWQLSHRDQVWPCLDYLFYLQADIL